MQKGVDYTGVTATTFCHDGQGKYLLGLRTDKCRDEHFRWDPVGSGGVKFGDSLEKTIHREVKEECGADVIDIQFLGFREVFREHEGRQTHWVAFDHRVQIDPTQVYITEPDKCLELRWCAIDEIPEPMHSQFPYFLEKYKDML